MNKPFPELKDVVGRPIKAGAIITVPRMHDFGGFSLPSMQVARVVSEPQIDGPIYQDVDLSKALFNLEVEIIDSEKIPGDVGTRRTYVCVGDKANLVTVVQTPAQTVVL
jgi:hypothetical protein